MVGTSAVVRAAASHPAMSVKADDARPAVLSVRSRRGRGGAQGSRGGIVLYG